MQPPRKPGVVGADTCLTLRFVLRASQEHCLPGRLAIPVPTF